MNRAFTLAEVLITLGIIGVVAAMTMPALVAEHQKKVAATRLEKFYSIMSQAVIRWEAEEGIIPEDFKFDSSIVLNGENSKEWFEGTIGKYVQHESIKNDYGTGYYFDVKLNDGSGFVAYVEATSTMNFFYCTQYKYCELENYDGRRTFLFTLRNGKFMTSQHHQNNMTREELLSSCKNAQKPHRHACTRLIQVDGWRIAKDYPW